MHGAGTQRPRRPGPTLLVVDDEPEVLRSVHDLLRIDYRVLTCESGAAALEILRSGEHVHVIMSDQRMPGMTGVEVLRQAKAIRPEATRLLFTAYADIRTVIDAINQGHVFRYLAKPWEPDELEAVVRQAVEHHDLIVEKNRLLAELQAANAKLTEANRLKGAFIEVASHELNTPVTVVLGMIELWKMSLGDAASNDRQWVDRIGAAARRLARTVERMLKLVRNGEFGQSLERQSVGLEPLVRRALDELNPYLELRGQSVTVAIEPDLGPIEVDPAKIADVLINLLANAVKFTPDGGTIRVAASAEPGASGWVRVRSPTRASGSRPTISNTSSSRSSPASTRCATRRAITSSASAGSAWGSGWSRPSSSCTAAGSRSPAARGRARPSRFSCRQAGHPGEDRQRIPSPLPEVSVSRPALASIARGVPSDRDPLLPGLDQAFTVQLESVDCGSPDRRQAQDDVPFIRPLEMVLPLLVTWIEQSDRLSRSRIGGGYPTSFRVVACGACQPEVVLLSGTSQHFGDQVFDLHGKACDCFLCEAVSATMGRLSGNSVSQGLGDIRVTHRELRNSEGSCPRCFQITAA